MPETPGSREKAETQTLCGVSARVKWLKFSCFIFHENLVICQQTFKSTPHFIGISLSLCCFKVEGLGRKPAAPLGIFPSWTGEASSAKLVSPLCAVRLAATLPGGTWGRWVVAGEAKEIKPDPGPEATAFGAVQLRRSKG